MEHPARHTPDQSDTLPEASLDTPLTRRLMAELNAQLWELEQNFTMPDLAWPPATESARKP